MSWSKQTIIICITLSAVVAGTVSECFGNGGPFVIKYPNGDPAAKGVLARLDPDLKPTTETRLKVIKEDLTVGFTGDRALPLQARSTQPPLARVSAKYTIENPTDEAITVDFGFPVLRGIYTNPYSMMPSPSATVMLDQKSIPCTIISNSAIYGIIRQRGQETITRAIESDAVLNDRVVAVKDAKDTAGRTTAQQALSSYLIENKNWGTRDAALMAQYAVLNVNPERIYIFPPDRSMGNYTEPYLQKLMMANLGALAAIGEQKATQFFAQLASCFDADVAAGYEAIFAAWGGDVQERSLDLTTGKIRPREITVDEATLRQNNIAFRGDPAVYARVDYLDENTVISEVEKDACRAILKNLPVVFTFAPMNILHYQVTFQPNATQDLTVSYQQYAYKDTRTPASYQLAYVVHPASFWAEFGPINLKVIVPEGVELRGCEKANIHSVQTLTAGANSAEAVTDGPGTYLGTVKSKTGEIYLAIDADSWSSTNADTPQPQVVRISKGQ